ncbi:MAG: DNAase [Desulfotalea sp.]|nr:MAG: DNAase [Desulfotalea sp.]
MKLIDSHCHLNADLLASQTTKIISDANAVGVDKFIVPGVIAAQWNTQLQLGSLHNGIYCGAGLHPLFLEHHHRKDLIKLEELCQQNLLVAIGEIGLDFYHGREREAEQIMLFEEQLSIADNANLPIILHVRKAHDQVLATLRKKQLAKGGTVHAFNGSIQQAKQYIDLGFAIGIGGAITYPRAKKLRKMAALLPEEAILLETDSPDMVVAGKGRGPNLPQYLIEILHVLAKLRQITPERLAEAITLNTKRAFNLG